MFRYYPYRKKGLSPVTREGGRCIKLVSNGDKGRRVKNVHFSGDVLFEWPLSEFARNVITEHDFDSLSVQAIAFSFLLM